MTTPCRCQSSTASAPSRPPVEPGPVLGSLCTGYGGLDLGVLAAFGSGRVAWVADPNPHVTRILASRLPDAPNHGDLRHINWAQVEPVEVLVAGFPCQDISAAGNRAGIEKGTRSGLWTDIMAGLRVLRPLLLIVENVAALRWRTGGLHRVLGDLAEAGYDALWRSVRAAEVGAAHRRERVFLLAWPCLPKGCGMPSPRVEALRLRRLVQSHQLRERNPTSVSAAHSTATNSDCPRCEELHSSRSHRRSCTVGRSTATGDDNPLSFGEGGNLPPLSDPAVPGPASAHTAWRDGSPETLANTPSNRRHEGMPGAAWFQGRPDAPVSGHPTNPPAGTSIPRRYQGRGNLLAGVAPGRATTQVGSASLDWGVYDAAIRRWEAVLGRPAPQPTEVGNHGRPVLAPTFVEHLMGLPSGWVTDLDLPRTAQLRALGNGVVPQQAAYAVSLLLGDLNGLLSTNYPPGRLEDEAGA
ncbi:DNA cytosine methyltransferase [Actinoalloteichus caeruleus]|uniref:DNA cytosine methyltransferase n=1 Tax=Actinoalloteichus cyanogriseus TaxID=2893586 RepID=UPI003AAE8FC6